ncbi:MAG TPA: signal recognition particle protein [Candidatus Marinimicrobia bacterium]|nr:signal recognition particle protein [Candidatus Neomarinimicrobiota bacterium]HIN25704.1 signal recognition particle protein [Candidatus Neomarinimicrobiota bacterium]
MFDQITERFDTVLRNLRGLGKITDKNIQETAREIRRILLEADVNFQVTRDFVKRVQERSAGTKVLKSVKPGEQFIKIIHDELATLLGNEPVPLEFAKKGQTVILMAGLQGSGKTATCVKLANRFKDQGKSALLVAADVYRPAAIKQLQVLADEIAVPVFEMGQDDPVKICSAAVEEAALSKLDCVILDTAGRLHVDGEMMVEIQQIAEAVKPTETLFVADGMTGQDAVHSAQAFNEALEITGTILTKLDGDARGGAAMSITAVTKKPVKFIGISEKTDGLEVFDPQRMADRILGLGDVVTLVEKAQKVVAESETVKIQEKLLENRFTLEDFNTQIKQLHKMGNLNQIMGMIPGVPRKMLQGMDLDDRQLSWTEAMINSMTLQERNNSQLINGRRRRRIAAGSGRSVQEVNQLLKQFTEMQKMMKKFGKMKSRGIRVGPFI